MPDMGFKRVRKTMETQTTNIVFQARGPVPIMVIKDPKIRKELTNYVEVDSDEEKVYMKKKSPIRNPLFEEDKNCSKSTDTDSESMQNMPKIDFSCQAPSPLPRNNPFNN
jgi:hypothetical protein